MQQLLDRLDQIVAELRALNRHLEQAERRRAGEASDERWEARLTDALARDEQRAAGDKTRPE